MNPAVLVQPQPPATPGPVTCAHQGSVTVAANVSTRLKVGGAPVLLAGLTGAAIPDCKTPVSQTTSPCLHVLKISIGESARLTVGGVSVVLDTLAGTTDGVPPPPSGPLLSKPTSAQSRLTAAVGL